MEEAEDFKCVFVVSCVLESKQISSSALDLGVTFDQTLRFTDHINIKVNKANRNVGLIFRTFTFMDKDMFLSIYKSFVRSHLEYASSACLRKTKSY